MRVVYFQRKPEAVHFSLEGYFDRVRREMETFTGQPPVLKVGRYLSRGFFPRLWIMIESAFCQGDINHIAGDITFAALFLHRRRTVVTIADCGQLEHISRLKYHLMLWLWFRLPVWRAHTVTTISDFTRRELIRFTKCPPEKVKVVYVSIADAFQPDPRPFNAVCPTVLQVGATDNKNIPNLARALRGIPCRLRIVGRVNNALAAVLRENAIDYSNVSNISENQLVEEYRNCDLVAFASNYEGFGMPILEAQAVGRPVVTSNVCSMPEIGGEAACYVEHHDPASIRQGLLRVIENQPYREDLIAKGFENVKRFSARAIARDFYNIYCGMLPRDTVPPSPGSA